MAVAAPVPWLTLADWEADGDPLKLLAHMPERADERLRVRQASAGIIRLFPGCEATPVLTALADRRDDSAPPTRLFHPNPPREWTHQLIADASRHAAWLRTVLGGRVIGCLPDESRALADLLNPTSRDDLLRLVYTAEWAARTRCGRGEQATPEELTVAMKIRVAAVLREVYRPPAWLTGGRLRLPHATCPPAWRTDTVTSLARHIWDTRDFSTMPILADALQDAGCDDAAVLAHCREPHPHCRGCWVLDALIGHPFTERAD